MRAPRKIKTGPSDIGIETSSAEMIGAQFGIGSFLLTAGNLMQSDELMAGVVILSLLGLAFGALQSWMERLFLRWR